MSEEEHLLLLCSRLSFNSIQAAYFARLVDLPLSWTEIIHLAGWQQISSLLYRHINEQESSENVPSDLKKELLTEYLATLAQNVHFESELIRVLEALSDKGIEAILLKGAHLSNKVYPDKGLRPMRDLDLLVADEQLEDAQAAIVALGFSPVGTLDEQKRTRDRHRHLPGLARSGSPVIIEVHRHIVRQDSGLYFDIEGLWSRAREMNLGGINAKVLAPEDLLIHLCINFFLDRRFSSQAALRQLCDVGESIRHYQEDICWQLLVDIAQEYGITGPVGLVLHLARTMLDAPVPEQIIRQISPGGFDSDQVERFVRRRVLSTMRVMASGLVSPEKSYQASTAAIEMFRRILSACRDRIGRDQSGHLETVQAVQLSRLEQGLKMGIQVLRRPGQAWEDLSIDRWHHSLYRPKWSPELSLDGGRTERTKTETQVS